jgi:hypothetical protein
LKFLIASEKNSLRGSLIEFCEVLSRQRRELMRKKDEALKQQLERQKQKEDEFAAEIRSITAVSSNIYIYIYIYLSSNAIRITPYIMLSY